MGAMAEMNGSVVGEGWSVQAPWLQIGVAIVLICLVRYWKVNRRPGQLRTWPVIGSLPTLIPQWNRLYDFLTERLDKHEVVSLEFGFGFKAHYIADPPFVEHILKTKFTNYPKGEQTQEIMRELLGHGIFAADGDQWKATRKVASYEFSSAILRDFSTEVFKERSLMLARIVSGFAKTSTPIDMQDLFMRLTLDATCRVGFGVELQCLTPSLPEEPFALNFDQANQLSFNRYVDPLWKMKRYFNTGSEKQLKQCVENMDKFCYRVINKRRAELLSPVNANAQPRPDLLSRFMSMTHGDAAGEAYSDKALRDHVVNFIIAGRDTTAITLSWFMHKICLQPEVAEKILEEIKALEQAENEQVQQSDDPLEKFAHVLSFNNMAKLHYLHAALTETLRLYPPVPLDGKIAVADDVLPNGFKITKGSMISYCAYAMGRLERIWGPDAKHFKAERWLKDGVFQPQAPFKFISFHGGNRACLGKESAYLQMKLAAAFLVRFFKFELVPNQVVKPRVMFVLAMAEGIKVTATPR